MTYSCHLCYIITYLNVVILTQSTTLFLNLTEPQLFSHQQQSKSHNMSSHVQCLSDSFILKCCIYILLLTGPPRHSGPKLMVGGSVERHSLNLEVTDQAASFNLIYIYKSLSFFTLYNCTATLTWFIPFWIKTPIPQNAVMIRDVEHWHSSSERCARYCQTLDMLLKETEATGMSCVSSIWAEIKPDCEGRCQLPIGVQCTRSH